MKRLIVTMGFIIILSSAFCTFVIPRTITVTATKLDSLRSSLLPASPAYDPYIADLSDSDDMVIPEGTEILPTRAAPDSVDMMNQAVIRHLQIALFNDGLDEDRVQDIVDILVNDIPADTLNALGYFRLTNVDPLVRALHLIYYTQNAAMLYDCLYYAPSAYVPDSVKTKLRDILYGTIQLTMDAIDSYDTLPNVQQREWGLGIPTDHPYPGFSIIQYRFQMLAASGLAALLLRETVPEWVNEMNEHLDYVNYVYFQQAMPSTFPPNEQFQGMLALHAGKSGAFIESLEYQSSMHQKLSLFFTAYKRLSGGSVNYFNNQHYVTWINDLIAKGVPTQADWPYNDNWGKRWISPGPIIFFYNNTDNPEVRENCAWYYKSKPSWSYPYSYNTSGESSCPSNLLVKYLSDPSIMPRLSSISSVPSFVSQGSLSNSEFTILREPIAGDISTAINGVTEAASMYILHDNSFAPYHNQSDHLSYSLYYKGRPFLIDPGYRVGAVAVPNPDSIIEWHYGREWMRSIYAHNMVIVDPDYEKELTELSDRYWEFRNSTGPGLAGAYRPTSPFTKYNEALVSQDDIVRDPSYRDYFQHTDQLDLLRTRVVYDDVISNLPKADLRRSFIKYGDIFLIFDDLEALDNSLHEYSSLYQFGVFNSSLASVNNTTHGFVIQKETDIVDMICGSTGTYENLLDGSTNGFEEECFPTSYQLKSSPDIPLYANKYGHPRGRTKVIDAADTSILTIIAPRETSNPITVQSTTHLIDNYFGVKASQNTISIPANPVTRYFGSTNGSQQNMTFGVDEINTDAKLFAVSVIDDQQPCVLDHSIVLLEGSSLEYNGIDLFQKFSGSDRGVTASYAGSALNVIFHGTTLSYPKFKVYRSGTDPDHFSATMHTRFENHDPVPFVYDIPDNRYPSTDIVQSLAYDNHYFYVNYTWADLVAANLIDDNLVLVKGEIPQADLYNDLNIDGFVEITGNLTIQPGASLYIAEDSTLLISEGFSILNHGLFHVSGGDSQPVLISAASQPWAGITTYRNGTLVCSGAVIDGATTGINIRGTASITNSEILNCNQGIAIETATPFSVDGNKIHLNTYGIVVSNHFTSSSLAQISDNELCDNGVGILFYNSNTKIAGNDIHNNTRAGIHMVRGSEPIIKDSNISFTEANGVARAEIRLESESYPIIDDARNDINSDGMGYSLYNASSERLLQLMARNNYWGSTNPFTIRYSIYPSSWDVVYNPFSMEPNTSFFHVNDNPFKQALLAEEGGDIALAKQLYATIVTTEPDSLYALQSLGRLNAIYSGSPEAVSDLRYIYYAYNAICSDSSLVKNANIKSIMIDRFDGLYPDALIGYEDELLLCNTELDSLLCLLDIAYTIQDMYYDDQTKGAHTSTVYRANGINISSLKEAKQEIYHLWDAILTISENMNADIVPFPTKLDITNYPNPFNPSTTIAFSLPDEGIVRLSVFNIRGQRVRELIDGSMPRGFHKVVWDGKDNSNRSVSSGLYFVRIETDKTSNVRKIMMLK